MTVEVVGRVSGRLQFQIYVVVVCKAEIARVLVLVLVVIVAIPALTSVVYPRASGWISSHVRSKAGILLQMASGVGGP